LPVYPIEVMLMAELCFSHNLGTRRNPGSGISRS
jgi:hypothetical protein